MAENTTARPLPLPQPISVPQDLDDFIFLWEGELPRASDR